MNHDAYVALRTRGRVQMPIGHPVGFDWEATIDGWDGRRFVRPAGHASAAVASPKVEYFGVEHVKNAPSRFYQRDASLSRVAYQGAYYGVSDVDTSLPSGVAVARVLVEGSAPASPAILAPASVPSSPGPGGDDGVPGESEGGGASVSPAAAAGGPQLTPALRLEAVRDFLREVGYLERHLTTMRDMVVYSQGRSGL